MYVTSGQNTAQYETMYDSKFVGALSSVNHKGLHQGWTQTSLYLQAIHFDKSLHHTSCQGKTQHSTEQRTLRQDKTIVAYEKINQLHTHNRWITIQWSVRQ